MLVDRVPPILQGVAQVRNWVIQNVPCTDSLLGYDLFLKLGNDFVAGQALGLQALAQGLPYPADQLVQHLRRFEQAGLVELSADEPGVLLLRPTQRFMVVLDSYSRKFDSLFIVRQEVRDQQLVVQATDPTLAELGRTLYDHVYDMGWLFLHNFGSACFLMASIMHRLAALHGHRSRIASCHVEVEGPERRYLLGAPGYAKAGQIDGHAVCVVDESVILDFGLGNVRKGYRRDFPWGTVCDYRRDGAVMGTLLVAGGETVTWKDDWQSPGTEAELARYAPHIDGLAAQYLERFR